MPLQPFRSLLVATDFSVSASHAIQRARQLPLAEGARLTLVHVVSTSLWSLFGQAPRHDAENELERVREELARSVSEGVSVTTELRTGTPYAEIVRAARDADAELVVLGRVGRSALRDHLLGSTAEQVVRNGPASVLLVRNARVQPYRRPMCAVDLEGAAEVVAAARRIAPEAVGPTTVLHVYDSPFEGMFFPSLSGDQLKSYRAEHRQRARTKLDAELAEGGVSAASRRLVLKHGSPRARVPDAVASQRADLLALGTHGHRGPAFALLGSVAGDILRDVACDTLVVRTSGVTVEPL